MKVNHILIFIYASRYEAILYGMLIYHEMPPLEVGHLKYCAANAHNVNTVNRSILNYP